MRDLAPDITRQRLLIEGYFAATVDRPAVERYLLGLARHRDLTTYGTPVIHSSAGAGKSEKAVRRGARPRVHPAPVRGAGARASRLLAVR
jgi:hypothetical protein